MPTTTGTYFFTCAESEGDVSRVRVFFYADELWVNDPDTGTHKLDTFCFNLTEPQWADRVV